MRPRHGPSEKSRPAGIKHFFVWAKDSLKGGRGMSQSVNDDDDEEDEAYE